MVATGGGKSEISDHDIGSSIGRSAGACKGGKGANAGGCTGGADRAGGVDVINGGTVRELNGRPGTTGWDGNTPPAASGAPLPAMCAA